MTGTVVATQAVARPEQPVAGEFTDNNYIAGVSRATLQHYSAVINWDPALSWLLVQLFVIWRIPTGWSSRLWALALVLAAAVPLYTGSL